MIADSPPQPNNKPKYDRYCLWQSDEHGCLVNESKAVVSMEYNRVAIDATEWNHSCGAWRIKLRLQAHRKCHRDACWTKPRPWRLLNEAAVAKSSVHVERNHIDATSREQIRDSDAWSYSFKLYLRTVLRASDKAKKCASTWANRNRRDSQTIETLWHTWAALALNIPGKW